jgi:hypothetical protein
MLDSSGAFLSVGIFWGRLWHRGDKQQVQAPFVGTENLEFKSAQPNHLAATGQMPQLVSNQATDGVVFIIGKGSEKTFVEFIDRGQGTHRKAMRSLFPDIDPFLGVVFVVDIPDNFLEDVFDGHKTRYATELVEHNRHVGACQTKFGKQCIETLAFRHEHRCAGVLAQVEVGMFGLIGLLGIKVKEFFDQKDACNFVATS